MSERIRLTYCVGEVEYSAELLREPIKLDDQTWDWLKSAFVGIGFQADNVERFFDEPGGDK